MRGRASLGVGFAVLAAGVAFAQDRERETLSAVNAERSSMDLPALALSDPLGKLARQRAEDITAYGALDFEPIPGSELLRRAWSLGYGGLVVQELTSVEDGTPCEVVESWNASLGPSDVYHRPEAREVGIGVGVVGDLPLTVLVVGVPPSPDPDKKRWPGIAPREYAMGDLFRDVDRRRVGLGLRSFERSEALDAAAQTLADAILRDPGKALVGEMVIPEGVALYAKGQSWQVATDGGPIDAWFAKHRAAVTAPGAPAAGGGLASRGREGRLEAVWVLLVAVPSR